MYLVPIQVPIYLDGDRELLTTEWRRSLELLRDSLGGHFGQVSVTAPNALLFTPTAEDTPRMIFDGYAAGLPLIAFDIEYVKERSDQERAAYLLPRGQIERSAVGLVELCRHPDQLVALSRNARSAADSHSAENWYRRRAEWTIDAVERHQRALMS